MTVSFETDRVLRAKDVAKILGVARSTVYRLVAAGTLRKQRPIPGLNQAVGWTAADVQRVLDEFKAGASE